MSNPTQKWQERMYAHLSYAVETGKREEADIMHALAGALAMLAKEDLDISFSELLNHIQTSKFSYPATTQSDVFDDWFFDDSALARRSPLYLFGYTVAEQEGLHKHTRRQILNNFFVSTDLPAENQAELPQWGEPCSSQRLMQMARHIKAMLQLHASPQAKEKWKEDLEWMHENLYRPSMRFHWPSMPSTQRSPAAKRTPNPMFMEEMHPSPALAAVIGAGPYPRTEVTKLVWEYIKLNRLQDATNKRLIKADAKLKKVLGKTEVTMFELTKLISSHLS